MLLRIAVSSGTGDWLDGRVRWLHRLDQSNDAQRVKEDRTEATEEPHAGAVAAHRGAASAVLGTSVIDEIVDAARASHRRDDRP